jgi:hypothetical protein
MTGVWPNKALQLMGHSLNQPIPDTVWLRTWVVSARVCSAVSRS